MPTRPISKPVSVDGQLQYYYQSTDNRGREVSLGVVREWLSEDVADSSLRELKMLDLQSQEIRVFGKKCTTPRKVYYMGDDTNMHHNYSGASAPLKPWNSLVEEWRNSIEDQFGTQLNSCLLNYYRDGNDYIGAHSDKEGGAPLAHVYSVSVGATRYFDVNPKDTKSGLPRIRVALGKGDLCFMNHLQEDFTHGIPKQVGVGERISATFRLLPK